MFTFIWNDPSQTSQTINLSVYKLTGTSENIICSGESTGATGILICDVSAYTGLFKAVVYRTASPTNILDTLFAEVRNTLISTSDGKTMTLFISAILAIFIFLAGILSPILAVIMGIIALITALLLGGIK